MLPDKCDSQSNTTQSADCVSRENLIYYSENIRIGFLITFIVVTIFSLIGNFAALLTIQKRKFKFIQRTCIICLSCSDIFSTIVLGLNYIETLMKPEAIWTLGRFLCSFIPMCQMAGVLFSSTALLFIAIDRYRNVVSALSQRWNPSVYSCLGTCAIVGLVGFGISSPMYNFFSLHNLIIVDIANSSHFTEQPASSCFSFYKSEMQIYYIVMIIIIFLPLTVTFIWLYIKIAMLVWKHRKPPISQNTPELEQSSSTKTTELSGPTVKKPIKCRDIRMERKIRTFKIVIMLIITFICCRLPYYGIFLLKLSLESSTGEWIWFLNFFSIVLHVINCGLNPFLYAFLNQTINFIFQTKKVIRTVVLDICCFCFSKSEFEDLDRENPFVIEGSKKPRVKFQEDVKECY